ncbi:hypothetical protein MO973_19930 [Paenibacillus sp. TRM 82003]|nr:hypothetical protein [Paenibacillus sp. TRM 82003]
MNENYIFHNDPYAEHYGEAYKQKIRLLHSAITEKENGTDKYIIFDFEAGLGKSQKTTQILDDYMSDFGGNDRNFLVVKRFNEDIVAMEKKLEHHNSHFTTTVLGITKDNWSKEWMMKASELKDIKVLIISHQRYKNLCLDDETREFFTDNRHTLIIDEKINFPIYTFSKTSYDKVRSYLPPHTQDDFDDVCNKLRFSLVDLDQRKNECARVELSLTKDKIDNLREIIDANWTQISEKHRNSVNDFIDGLYLWYSTKCVYNAGNISTFNRKHQLWGLSNNIILDASAGMDGVYRLHSDYRIFGQGGMIDHSSSQFTIVNYNSSKSRLNADETDIYPEIAAKIKETHKDGDKVLIVCHKDNANKIRLHFFNAGLTSIGYGDDYNGEDIAINWFGNLIGKNHYDKFNVCWIVGTPNLPYEQYLIHYMQYSRADSLGRKGLKIFNGRFANETFLNVQNGYLAAEIYQSIKRIQRNVQPTGRFFIVNNDAEIIGKVLKKIKGSDVNRKSLTFDFVSKKEEERKKNKEAKKVLKKDNADLFLEHVAKLSKGKHSKKQIRDDLGLDSPHFNRIFQNDKVRNLINKRFVVEYHHIVKL